jgi:two-component system sensor histidine kinase EvgS
MRQLLFLLLFVSTFIYANSIELTPKEKLFIKENPKITLGVGNGWDPAVIVKGDKVDGFDADILNLINKATGANFVFEVGIWKDIQELAKKKKYMV